MWFNAIIRAEPYQFLNIFNGEFLLFSLVQKSFLILDFTGVAWLSSARAVRCLVNSFNERNFHFILVIFFSFIKYPLLLDCRLNIGRRWKWRQVLMALINWATHVLQWYLQKVLQYLNFGANLKKILNELWAATRSYEVGIASNRRSERYGELSSRSCTHRPSHARISFYLEIFF